MTSATNQRVQTAPPVSRTADFLAAGYALAYTLFLLAISWTAPALGDLDLDTDFYGDLVLAAQALVRGHFSVENYPYKGPLYSLVIAAVHAVVGDWYRAAVTTSALGAGAALFAVFRLTRQVFGSWAALGTSVATSLIVDFFVHAHHATTDVLFLALAVGSLALFCGQAPAWRSRGLAGALAGLAFLTRYNGLVLPLAALACDFVVAREDRSRAARTRAAAWFVGAFLLVASPWFVANLHATGRLLPGKNAQNVVAGLFGAVRWSQVHADDEGGIVALLREAPLRAGAQFVRNLVTHFGLDLQQLLEWPLALLALAGAAGLLLRPPNAPMRCILCFAIGHFLAMGLLFYSPRFSFFLAPMYLSAGFSFLTGSPQRPRFRWANRWRARFLDGATVTRAALVVGIVLLGCAAFQIPRMASIEHRLRARQPLYLLAAAEALRTHAGTTAKGDDPPVLMARKGHLAFVAGLKYQPYPIAAAQSLESLIQFARQHGVRYVTYGSPEFDLCPDLRFMAVTDSIPGLDLVYAAARVRIFQLNQAQTAITVSDADQLAMFETNVRIADKRGVPDIQARALGELAQFQAEHGATADAEAAYHRIIDLCNAATVHRDAAAFNGAIAGLKLARLLLDLGRGAEAAPLADASAAYFERQGPASNAVRAYLLAARCQDSLGQAAQSAARTAKARDLEARLPRAQRRTAP